MLLAREFARAGHEVVVLTESKGDGRDGELPFEVVRRPTLPDLLRRARRADVVFHNNISLRAAWPLLVVRKPWVVAHHIWLPKGKGLKGAKAALKQFVLRYATGIAISQAIADNYTTPSTVIPDPYDDDVFRLMPGVERDRDLVFVGRFIADKGLQDLLRTLAQLKTGGLSPNLTVIGAGPAEAEWRKLSEELGLSSQVRFAGRMGGDALAAELNRHRVLVVPSLWNEPFGVVALEGMACGCVVVGSEGGGLAEAIGPGGLTYPNGDVPALGACIVAVLSDDELAARCRAAALSHLAKHLPPDVAARYLELFPRNFSG